MEIPRHWRLKAQRYRLQGSLCPTCGQPSFPPRRICPHCMAQVGDAADTGDFLAIHSIAIPELAPHIRHQATKLLQGE